MANLTQLKALEVLDAFLLIDKPAGISFNTVVKTVKRKFNLVKVGHGGSLDTMASGLLVLLINDANKFVDKVMGADRTYSGLMQLGLKTDTNDLNGRTVGGDATKIKSDFTPIVPEFKGDIFQTEPQFCAVRREDTLQYEIVDTGAHQPFMAHVYRIEIARVTDDQLSFEITGTKGLIVRALVNDFGDLLGSGAALSKLRRLKIGKFHVNDAIPFNKLLETSLGDLSSCVIPLRDALQ